MPRARGAGAGRWESGGGAASDTRGARRLGGQGRRGWAGWEDDTPILKVSSGVSSSSGGGSSATSLLTRATRKKLSSGSSRVVVATSAQQARIKEVRQEEPAGRPVPLEEESQIDSEDPDI